MFLAPVLRAERPGAWTAVGMGRVRWRVVAWFDSRFRTATGAAGASRKPHARPLYCDLYDVRSRETVGPDRHARRAGAPRGARAHGASRLWPSPIAHAHRAGPHRSAARGEGSQLGGPPTGHAPRPARAPAACADRLRVPVGLDRSWRRRSAEGAPRVAQRRPAASADPRRIRSPRAAGVLHVGPASDRRDRVCHPSPEVRAAPRQGARSDASSTLPGTGHRARRTNPSAARLAPGRR